MRNLDLSLAARIGTAHDWVARDGRAWAFRFVFVDVYDARGLLPDLTSGVPVLLSEDDVAELAPDGDE